MGASTPGAVGGQVRSPGRAAAAIRDLHPGHFTFVMATGIISTGAFLLGPSWLSSEPAKVLGRCRAERPIRAGRRAAAPAGARGEG
jgi:hypothetical protein